MYNYYSLYLIFGSLISQTSSFFWSTSFTTVKSSSSIRGTTRHHVSNLKFTQLYFSFSYLLMKVHKPSPFHILPRGRFIENQQLYFKILRMVGLLLFWYHFYCFLFWCDSADPFSRQSMIFLSVQYILFIYVFLLFNVFFCPSHVPPIFPSPLHQLARAKFGLQRPHLLPFCISDWFMNFNIFQVDFLWHFTLHKLLLIYN